jgi:alpha-glucuronidase
LEQLKYQAGHSIVWRDAINDWFHRISGVADDMHRVGHHPGRVEAEALTLTGYEALNVTPWETASGGRAVVCHEPLPTCRAEMKFQGAAGWYEVDTEYFDQSNGVSRYKVYLNQQLVDEWTAGLSLPATKPNGDSSTRHRSNGLALRPGDSIRIEAIPDDGERAPLDYLEIRPLQD